MVLLSRFESSELETLFREVAANGTLIMPTIGCGNVDQMIADVLIYSGLSSNSIKRVGQVYSSHIQSIIGVSAYDIHSATNTCPATGIELYCSTNSSFVFLQIRSQPKDGYAPRFVDDLMTLLKEWAFKSVLLISSADSTYYDISQIRDTMTYYTTSQSILEQVGERLPSINIMNTEVLGSGLLSLLPPALKEASVDFTTMIALVNEGRNFRDALEFTKRICSLLAIIPEETLQMPPSWGMIDPWLFDEDDIC